MKTSTWQADILLLITAVIWGLAFVAQRVGMEHIGPFLFNAARFTLGLLSLLPLLWFGRKSIVQDRWRLVWGSFAAGLLLYAGSSLQQIGLVYTTAGKAGFITGLYIVLVPFLAHIWGYRTAGATWLGAILALVGLFMLSMTDELSIAHGDLLELIGAFFWAGHVLLIGWLSRRCEALQLAFGQFFVCAVLSFCSALIWEPIVLDDLMDTWIPISYAGFLSVGVAYTLQVVAQRRAPAAHAAIILGLEAVFAALGGWLLLNETLSMRGLVGCGLMLAGMLISQLPSLKVRRAEN
jgi:drug/metabolite transporter (DMT)-like permease